MSEYQFHWWQSRAERTIGPRVAIAERSHLHGAALALRQFAALGCDMTAPLAHVDVRDADGASHIVLVEEVLDWLREPAQVYFVHHEGLDGLLS
jgi:hypothetical protein